MAIRQADGARCPLMCSRMGQEIENPLFARFFHRFCGRDRGRGEQELRREMLAGATGRVVEVGAGNGINFPHYPSTVAARPRRPRATRPSACVW
jgi:hypothetical protein